MKRTTTVRHYLGPFTITIAQLEQLRLYVINELSDAASELRLSMITVHDSDTKYVCADLDEFMGHRMLDRDIDNFQIDFCDAEHEKVVLIVGGKRSENYVLVGGRDKAWVLGASSDLQKKMREYEAWYGMIARGLWGSTKSFAVLYFIIAGLLFAAYAIYLRPEIVEENSPLSRLSWVTILIGPIALVLTWV